MAVYFRSQHGLTGSEYWLKGIDKEIEQARGIQLVKGKKLIRELKSTSSLGLKEFIL